MAEFREASGRRAESVSFCEGQEGRRASGSLIACHMIKKAAGSVSSDLRASMKVGIQCSPGYRADSGSQPVSSLTSTSFSHLHRSILKLILSLLLPLSLSLSACGVAAQMTTLLAFSPDWFGFS